VAVGVAVDEAVEVKAGVCVRVGDGVRCDPGRKAGIGEGEEPAEVEYWITANASAVCVAEVFFSAPAVTVHPSATTANPEMESQGIWKTRTDATATPAEEDGFSRPMIYNHCMPPDAAAQPRVRKFGLGRRTTLRRVREDRIDVIASPASVGARPERGPQ
jgi:hypothetical protein